MPEIVEKLKLAEAITHLLEECRMVLPGVQALFGFQLIAVFNRSFSTRLMPFEQDMHLVALALVALSVALLMTPAALHRQSPREASERFLRVGGRFLLAAMPPLLCAIAIDFFLIAHLVLGEAEPAAAITAALLVFFVACWFVFPLAYRRLYHRR